MRTMMMTMKEYDEGYNEVHQGRGMSNMTMEEYNKGYN